jgi:hypothetical protein
VPFGNVTIPVLACDDLAVFKAMFGRAKDWVDIATMVTQLDADYVTHWVEHLLGSDSPALARLHEVLRTG